MEVIFPEDHCESSPSGAHHFTQLIGTIWRCKYCWATKWLPISWNDVCQFSIAIRTLGLDKAYQKSVNRRPHTKVLLSKLEKIRLIRKVLPEDELMIAIAVIVTEHKEDLEDETMPSGTPYLMEPSILEELEESVR